MATSCPSLLPIKPPQKSVTFDKHIEKAFNRYISCLIGAQLKLLLHISIISKMPPNDLCDIPGGQINEKSSPWQGTTSPPVTTRADIGKIGRLQRKNPGRLSHASCKCIRRQTKRKKKNKLVQSLQNSCS